MEALKLPFLLSVLCLSLSVQNAGAAPRIFTKTSGEKVTAEIVSADAEYLTLLIGKRERNFAIADFSDADQPFISEWIRKETGLYEWTHARGYRHDGSTDEVILDKEPKVLWRAKVGKGDAPVVASTRHAVATGVKGGKFTITTFDLKTGQVSWSNQYPVSSTDGAAGAAASIDKIRSSVLTMGPNGRIDSWKLKGGDNRWATLISSSYKTAERPVSNRYGTPLLFDSSLFVEIGGPAYSLVKLSSANGQEAWRAGKHQSVGAIPILATLAKQQVIVSRNAYGIVARRASTGAIAWDQAWPNHEGHASPLGVPEDRIFVTSADECAMFRIGEESVEKLWSNANLCSRHATPIFHDGFLYGIHGKQLRCIDAASGDVKWTADGIEAGNLIRAADQLVIQTAISGEVVFAGVNSERFAERLRYKVFAGPSQAMPVLAAGRLFCRSSSGDVTCVDLGVLTESKKPVSQQGGVEYRGK